MDNSQRFAFDSYLVRRKVLKLIGGAFHVYGPNNDVLLYANQKAFKLKEDIRLYTGEDMNDEVLTISARNILDFSATYDVKDAKSGQRIGSLQRNGLKSMLRDEWVVFGPNEEELGTIKEDSGALALIRRFVSNLIPKKYTVMINEQLVCIYKNNFNPLVSKVSVDFSMDSGKIYDRRLGIAAAVLLAAIEGKE